MKKILIGLSLLIIISITTLYFIGYINSSNQQKVVYENKEFNYQVTLPKGWTIPALVNSYVDLYRKKLTKEVYSQIFDDTSSSTGVIVKDKEKLAEFDKEIPVDMKTWDPYTAEFIMFTNATTQEQSDFYTEVNNKEKNLVTDFFPNRVITIEPSDYMPEINSTTTISKNSTRISKVISVNGIQSQYNKIIHPIIGASYVYIPVKTDKLNYDGNKIIAFKIFLKGSKISDEDFMKIVNSFTLSKN